MKLVCLAALAGAIALAVIEHNAVARARAEQQTLVSSQQEAEKLAGENAELSQLRGENAQVKKLEQDNRDLPRLRNEVRQLREQAAEAEKLRADNQRLATAQNTTSSGADSVVIPADYLSRAALAEAGLSTPEATIQTFFHAMFQGDLQRAQQCHLGAETREMTKEQEAAESKRLQDEGAGFPGYRIAEKNILSADEVQVGIQSVPGGVIAPIKLKLIGSEWKIE